MEGTSYSEFLWLSADIHRLSLPSLRAHKLITAAVISTLLYSLYYLNFAVRRPKIFGASGSWREHLLSGCPSLRRLYWPTVWAFGAHMTTILRAVLQRDLAVKYEREILVLSDGGELGLDWTPTPPQASGEDQTRPILLIIPGITGSSDEKYIKYFVLDGLQEGYRPVVMNQRGTGGVQLKTYRTYCASDISDLAEVMFRIQTLYPQAAVMGLGISLGGMILTQYLHQLGKECDMKAVLSISAAFNPFRTKQSLEERLDNRILYSRFLTNKLVDIVKRNTSGVSTEVLESLPYNVQHVLQCRAISEFDERLTVPVFGFASLADYYSACRNDDKLHAVSRPLLCLTAEDDPFVPPDSLPHREFQSNPHTVLVQTARGGHMGFIEGLLPRGGSLMNRVCREFLHAAKNYEN